MVAADAVAPLLRRFVPHEDVHCVVCGLDLPDVIAAVAALASTTTTTMAVAAAAAADDDAEEYDRGDQPGPPGNIHRGGACFGHYLHHAHALGDGCGRSRHGRGSDRRGYNVLEVVGLDGQGGIYRVPIELPQLGEDLIAIVPRRQQQVGQREVGDVGRPHDRDFGGKRVGPAGKAAGGGRQLEQLEAESQLFQDSR